MDVGDGSCFLFASKTAALSIVDDGVEGINFSNDYLLNMVVWFCERIYFLFFLRANYCNSNLTDFRYLSKKKNSNLTDFCATGKDMQIKLEEDSCGLPENVTKSFVEQIVVFRPSSDSYCWCCSCLLTCASLRTTNS